MAFWLLCAFSALLTAATILLARQRFLSRGRARVRVADDDLYGALGLVGFLLPRSARAIWNSVWLAAAVFGLGTPHHLALYELSQELSLHSMFIYFLALLYWLALMIGVGGYTAGNSRAARLASVATAP